MAKLTLTDLATLENQVAAIATLNANSAAIETALEKTLSRDGTSPNEMDTDLDMNSNEVINLAAPTTLSSAARLADVLNNPAGALSILSLTFIINTLPRSLPSTPNQLWVNGGVLCVS